MVKLVALALGAGLVVLALVLVAPWQATSTREEPASASVALDPAPATPSAPTLEPLVLPEPPPVPIEVGSGDFEDAEHATSGRARVVEVSDGSRYVRLEGLDTTDGPDLHVWLSAAPSGGDRGSYDDSAHVDLGELVADRGDHDYEIPVGADLRGIRSVVIWSQQAGVAFGTAPVALR